MSAFWATYLNGLYAMLGLGLLGWVISLVRKNVTHVDSMWSLFFLAAMFVYQPENAGIRPQLMWLMVLIWSLRLCIYLTWRNWGPHEDHRYIAIRNNNQPHFWLKSIYIIFGLQALLAWLISLPLLAASQSTSALNLADYVGLSLWVFGYIWESVGDWQLALFKADPANKGKVLSTGLWGLSRHPNYFGECCLWWGYYLLACAARAWWSLPAPLLMTLLLLKVSGVALLEKDIADRRPDYVSYMSNTNAFLPWLKRARKESKS